MNINTAQTVCIRQCNPYMFSWFIRRSSAWTVYQVQRYRNSCEVSDSSWTVLSQVITGQYQLCISLRPICSWTVHNWQFGSMITVPFVLSSVLLVRDNFAILPVLVQEGEIFQIMPEWAHFSQRGYRRWQKACACKIDPKIPLKTCPLPTCTSVFLILQILKAFPKSFPTKMTSSEKNKARKVSEEIGRASCRERV